VTYLGARAADGTGDVLVADAAGGHAPLPGAAAGACDWGAGAAGAAAAALARAILAHASGDPEEAEALCAWFAQDVVARLPRPGFALAGPDVLAWIDHEVIIQG
jgi:hypothetical protein